MNIAQLERDLAAKQEEARNLFAKTGLDAQNAKNDKGESAPRERTKEESDAVQAFVNQANEIKQRIGRAQTDANMTAEIEKLTAGMTTPKKSATGGGVVDRRSMGDQFMDSAAGKWLRETRGMRSGIWTSPQSEMGAPEMRATVIDESSGSSGPLIVTQYMPGILEKLYAQLRMVDLLGSGSIDSTTLTYMRETTFTNAAAPVAEGGLKPESTLVFDQVTATVRKLAHWFPVTEETLDDVSVMRSVINARLNTGLDMTEDDQLLNGSGTAPALTGLLNTSGLTTATTRSGSVTNADAILTAINAVFNASFVQPTGVVLNPANWLAIQQSKDGNGNYYGSGPFAGPQVPTIWGLPVVSIPAIVANTGLVGAFKTAAMVFRKGGTRIDATNSHDDFFVRNLVAIRGERRLLLAVFRPAAFSKVLSLT